MRIDPIYQLPIVTCPECGRSTVRRRHPLVSAWRWFRRFDLVSGVFLVQLACGIGALAIATTLVWSHAPWVVPGGGVSAHPAPALLKVFGAGAVGVWIGLGLGHHGLIRATVGFLCAVAVMVSATHWLGPLFRRSMLGTVEPMPHDFSLASVALRSSWLLAPGAVGVALGAALRRAVGWLWPFWWRRTLRRMRRSRSLS